jgi:two-component system, NarL family, nitrate/nitrite response regulator NarL
MNLLVIDDHLVILDGIRSIIPPGKYNIVAEAHDAKSGLHYFKYLDINIVITDIQLPDKSGIELIREMKKIKPEVKIAVLSMFDERAMVGEAMEAGADAYIVKSAEPSELTRALERICSGKKYLCEDLSNLLWEQEPQKKSLLTDREKEVLKFILSEKSNKEIAALLFISERTVESHRKNLYRKTNTETLVGLVKYAIDNKLV